MDWSWIKCDQNGRPKPDIDVDGDSETESRIGAGDNEKRVKKMDRDDIRNANK